MFAFLHEELRRLDQSASKLRWFGWLFAGIFLATALWLRLKAPAWPAAFIFVLAGALLLFAAGWKQPEALRSVHKYWMAFALCLGWVVSRILLTLLFFLVVIPTGLAGRVFGWRFTEMRRARPGESLWIDKPPRERAHHDKLY